MNNNNDDFQIGKSNYDRKGSNLGGNWFYLKDNTDNIFRVLPPLFSLAANGQYSKWYAVHRGLRGSNGKQYPFLCTEEIDRKTKVIVTQCPICNKRRENEAKQEVLKQSGATKEQLNDFNLAQVFPYIAERKYYINVVNQENKVGVLSIGSKMHQSLEALCKQWEAKGFDLTGMTGLFLNFKVSKKFKGDKEAVHSAEVFMQPSADMSFRPVTHEITKDFIVRLKDEASDLTELFKTLPQEQMAILASASGQQRGQIIDKIFGAGENKDGNKASSALNTQVPGTGATLVGRTEVDGGNVNLQMPQMPVNGPAPVPNNNTGSFAGLNNTNQLQQQTLPPNAVASPAPAAAAANRTNQLSDEDFYAIMGQGKK